MFTDVSFIKQNHIFFNTLIDPAGHSLQRDINRSMSKIYYLAGYFNFNLLNSTYEIQ